MSTAGFGDDYDFSRLAWKVKDTSIISVEKNSFNPLGCKITGLKSGTTTLTASIENVSCDFTITVYSKGSIALELEIYFTTALGEERRAVEKEIKEAKKKIPDLITELEKKLTEQKLVAHPIEQQRKELEESILGNLRPMTDIIGETKKDSEIQVEKSDEPYINEKGEYYLFDIDAPAGIMAEAVEPYDNGELDDLSITPAQTRATKTEQAKIVHPILRGEKTGLWTAFKEFKQHGVFDIQGKTIALTPSGKISRTGWRQFQAAASIYRSKKFETFRYILLDRNDGEIKDQLAITSYMPNATVASLPENDTIKKVLTRAEQNDCLIALVHNHPSGDTTPSVQDIESTEILLKVMRRADGLNRFAGHIILDHENFSLYTPKDGWQTIETSRNGKDPLIKESLPEWGMRNRPRFRGNETQ